MRTDCLGGHGVSEWASERRYVFGWKLRQQGYKEGMGRSERWS